MGRLDNKVILVVGAGEHLGRSAPLLFAQEGACVVIAARRRAVLDETADLIRAQAGRVTTVAGSAANRDDVDRMIAAAVEGYGRLDVLYNNIGGGWVELDKKIHELSDAAYNQIVLSHPTSVFNACRAAIAQMLRQGEGGSVINATASRHVRRMANPVYAYTKAGMIEMTRNMAKDYLRDHIRVEAAGQRHGLLAVGRLGDYRHVVVLGQDAAQPLAKEGMVVGDQEPDAFHRVTGCAECSTNHAWRSIMPGDRVHFALGAKKAYVNIAPRQVGGLLEELGAYHAAFADLFRRAEQRHWARKYMEGQLLDLERKSLEPMARALDGGNVQAMQQFIGVGAWEDEPLLRAHRGRVAGTIGHPEGVVILEGIDPAPHAWRTRPLHLCCT